MTSQRDPFANFERMRREMDELFGDPFERHGLSSRRRRGFSPAVDVYYRNDPPRAVVEAELAGVDAGSLTLEVHGRELTIAGRRGPAESEGRVYQQVEIEHGSFRRVIQLSVDVLAEQAKAVYEDGLLRVELPIQKPSSQRRRVPIELRRTSARPGAPTQPSAPTDVSAPARPGAAGVSPDRAGGRG